MFQSLNPNGPDFEKMRGMMLPHIDQGIRHAISMCWAALPADRRNADEVEKEIRRIVDRAIQNLRDDATAFGIE
jgi:hypothetical protein